jgi:hypothetical protein
MITDAAIRGAHEALLLGWLFASTDYPFDEIMQTGLVDGTWDRDRSWVPTNPLACCRGASASFKFVHPLGSLLLMHSCDVEHRSVVHGSNIAATLRARRLLVLAAWDVDAGLADGVIRRYLNWAEGDAVRAEEALTDFEALSTSNIADDRLVAAASVDIGIELLTPLCSDADEAVADTANQNFLSRLGE